MMTGSSELSLKFSATKSEPNYAKLFLATGGSLNKVTPSAFIMTPGR